MKKLLTVSLQAVLVGVLFWGGSAYAAEKPITIVFENVYPASHVRLGAKATVGMWLQELESRTKGLVKIETHWAGEPIPTKQTMDALSLGTIDMLVAFPPYFSGKVGITDICAMPGNFRHYSDIYDLWWNSPVGELIDKAYQKKLNVKCLFPIIFAPENFQIGKRSKKIREFADFKGLKIRAGGGMPNMTVKAIGGVPVQTVGGEYYTAMEKGIIDAGLMGTYSLKTYRMWEVCDEVVNPPIFPHCWVAAWMNLDKWKSLGPRVQNIILDSARVMETRWISFVEMSDASIRKEAVSHGVEFYTLPPKEEAKMWAATDSIWDKYVENCRKQGLGKEAQEVRQIVQKRFNSYQ
jgi:TRAP-type C4-dicarboxylate transport system substrate-binding protein